MDLANVRGARCRVALTLGLVASLWFAGAANAVDFTYSGFASVVGGVTYGACTRDNTTSDAYNASCTRFIADWAHGGVYTSDWSMQPESKLGLQGSVRFTSSLSVTAQVVGRVTNHTGADLEWAYLTYDLSPSWTVQLGRKRLPLYYFSTTQDVGYSYPWVRLPADIYGWDAVNYNGANLGYATYLSRGWMLKSNIFAGEERTNDSAYAALSYNEPKDIKWPKIRGGDLELSREWLTTRLTYIVSDYQQIDRASKTADVLPSGTSTGQQRIYGASMNVDAEPWLVRSEYSVFDRDSFQFKSKAWMIGGGVRMGKFLPMLTASRYHETTQFPDGYTPVGWTTKTLSVRYEVGDSSALKIQWDRLREDRNTYAGDSNVLSLSYDVIF